MKSPLNSDIKLATRRELTHELYQHYPLTFIMMFLIASILMWELDGYVKNEYLSGWYAAFCLSAILRYALLIWYRYTKSRLHLQAAHYYLYILGACSTSLCWGILGSALMPADALHQTVVLIIISGIMAGAVQSLNASYLAAMTYVLGTLVPVLIWQAFQILDGSKIYIGISALMSAYFVFSFIVSRRANKVLIDNIQLKFANIDLLKNLTAAKNELKISNENLKKYTVEIDLFSKMGELLRTCLTQEEIFEVSSQFVAKIFPDFSGGLYLMNDTKNRLILVKSWGSIPIDTVAFSLEDCWAVRHKNLHISNDATLCQHQYQKKIFNIWLNGKKRQGVFHANLMIFMGKRMIS